MASTCALIFLNDSFFSSSFLRSNVYRNRREAFNTRAACYNRTNLVSTDIKNNLKKKNIIFNKQQNRGFTKHCANIVSWYIG